MTRAKDQEYTVISIHAPVKGATPLISIPSLEFKISIHAPVKGATSCAVHRVCGHLDFNPRPREGSDSFFLL